MSFRTDVNIHLQLCCLVDMILGTGTESAFKKSSLLGAFFHTLDAIAPKPSVCGPALWLGHSRASTAATLALRAVERSVLIGIKK